MKLSNALTNTVILGSAVLTATLASVAPAFADTATYDWNKGAQRLENGDTRNNWGHFENDYNDGYVSVQNSHGFHKSVTTSFDSVDNILTWNSVFEERDGKTPNGGWLVLTDGENPKYQEQEYAIFYMDGVSGKLSAYSYNGVNGSNSYTEWDKYNKETNKMERQKANAFLGSWDDAVNVVDNGTERSISFSVDVSSIFDVAAINANSVNANRNKLDANQWKGTGFGEELGVWFHATQNPDATYNTDGTLKTFTGSGSWFDSEGGSLHATNVVKKTNAVAVPEPASMGLLGLGLVGFGTSSMKRRLKKLSGQKAS